MTEAVLLRSRKRVYADGAILSIRIWGLVESVPPCEHRLKYSLFYGYPGCRLVGYDNERGKGDHRHLGETETPYLFTNISRLLIDFAEDVERERGKPP
ncbi:MAG: DUF6516 family protein [Rhodospirillaceae bacterium]